MRIFAYEWVSAGAVVSPREQVEVSPSLASEGAAMLRALVDDFAAIADRQVEVAVVVDASFQSPPWPANVEVVRATSPAMEWQRFRSLAARADATVVIAPELDGCLIQRVACAMEVGGRLLSPTFSFCQVAGDKQATAERLTAAGVAVPQGVRLTDWDHWPAAIPCPAVLKPIDGAGSNDVQLLRSPRFPPGLGEAHRYRLEQYHAGRAVSVAAFCGPAGWLLLPACAQHLSNDGRFHYQGGRCPVERSEQVRAHRLVHGALQALPPAIGYVGFDLVLGADTSGRDDAIIEVNPRLTTSYVGLRARARENLAAAMLDIAEGRTAKLSFHNHPVEFDPTGRCWPAK